MGTAALGSGTLLGAGDIYHNDGPFDRPDNYNRVNTVLRYHRGEATDFLTVTAMGYYGKWNATDQVPAHAIDQGVIGRFGTLNPSDGGRTSRASLSFNRVKRTDADQVQFSAYAIRYKLDLWSTFTYYLQDPVNGDQIAQHDDRYVYGFKGSKTWFTHLFGLPSTNLLGVQARVDDIRNVGIDRTFQRQYLATQQQASVVEANGGIYFENSTQWLPGLRTVLGLREDAFSFDVTDKMLNPDRTCNIDSDPLGCNSGTVRANIFSPKLGIVLGPWVDSSAAIADSRPPYPSFLAAWRARTSYFLTVAEGYHSNDARGVTRSGESPDAPAVTPLTRAISAELGLSSDPVAGWHSSLDLFLLKLGSELVFAGDAGVTEPSGSTTRMGIEWSNSYRINEWLHADLNAAFSRARFDHDVQPGRYIPNSPTNIVDASLTAQHPSGWFGSVRARHFGDSPLVEDNSAKSPAYTTVDLEIGYQRTGQWRLAVDVFNLFDKKWDDIEYYYASRLKNEPAARPDFVVHPGVPLTVRAHLQYFL